VHVEEREQSDGFVLFQVFGKVDEDDRETREIV